MSRDPHGKTVRPQPGKRILDLALAVPATIVLLPVLGVVAALVRWRLGRPVLFRQIRPGRNGAPFALYKFRTMTDTRDERGNLLPDARRLTPLGRFLRESSIDELPELFNILKGDMSLVGPRPLLTRYLPFYTERERLRHAVRPGLTGWAQIHGRNHVPWDQRLALDVWYVENWSLRLDLRILARTVLAVVRRHGAAADPDTAETDLDRERMEAASRS